MRERWKRRYLLMAAILLSGWTVSWKWLGPYVVRAVYEGERFSFLAGIMAARDRLPLEAYLSTWDHLARTVGFWLVPALCIPYLFLVLRGGPGRGGAPRAAESGTEAEAEPSLLLSALFFGLTAGLGEAYYLTGKNYFLQEVSPGFRWVSEQTLWMAPLAALGVFLLLALGLRAFRTLIPRQRREETMVFAFSALCVVDWLLMTGSLHWLAVSILSLGVGAAVVRTVRRRSRRYRRLCGKGVVLMSAVVVIGAGLTNTVSAWQERRARARLPTPPPDASNVLLVVLDTERAQSFSLYGRERATTPRLDSFARRATVFERAIAPAAWTLPSHASMFTGRYNRQLGTGKFTGLDDTYPTLAEVLSSRGYYTGGFVANIFYCSDLLGLDRGFIRYRDHPVSGYMILASFFLTRRAAGIWSNRLGNHQDLVRKRAAEVNDEFFDWMAGLESDRPFFAFLNYFDAHGPYLPPDPYRWTFGDADPLYWAKHGSNSSDYTVGELRQLRDAYESSVAYADRELGRLLDTLKRRGVLENTVVIITSDHGEAFGSHGKLGHSQVYEPVVHVPLVIRDPTGAGAGRRIDRTVSLRRIPRTVVQTAGLEGRSFPGRSLAPLWRSAVPEIGDEPGTLPPDTVLSEAVPGAISGAISLVADSIQYVRHPDGREELYNLAADSGAQRDLSESESWRPILDRFARTADSFLERLDRRAPPR